MPTADADGVATKTASDWQATSERVTLVLFTGGSSGLWFNSFPDCSLARQRDRLCASHPFDAGPAAATIGDGAVLQRAERRARRGAALQIPHAGEGSAGAVVGSMTRILSLLLVCLSALVVRAENSQAALDDAGRTFLMRGSGFTDDDLRKVGNGGVASRSLATQDGREVATAGIVRVAITPEEFNRRLSDIASFERADAVLQIGTFSDPPDISDVAGLTLESADVRNLRSCRVGDCGLQVSSHIIDRLQREVNWREPSAAERANVILRSSLVNCVQAYRTSGHQDRMVYVDESERVDVAAEFLDLVSSDTGVLPTFPDLRRHLMGPPASAPTTSDVVYWSKEKVARKEVVSVTHLTIARQPSTSPFAYVAGSKQLCGSHYCDASPGLTIVLRDPTSPASAYVAYVNRSRVDAFGGLFGGITRRIVGSRARGALADFLEGLQRRLDTASYANDRLPAARAANSGQSLGSLNADRCRMTIAAPTEQKLPSTFCTSPTVVWTSPSAVAC